jgi:hypothetical protein
MHTAKKDEYDFSTHIIKGTSRFLRKGVSYKEEDKLEELSINKKVLIDENQTPQEQAKSRYKVLEVEGKVRKDGVTIHSSNLEKLNNTSKVITKDSGSETVMVLDIPIKVKAGEIIGQVGEYNLSTKKGNKLLHLEVFTSDDVKAFAKASKIKFKNDTNSNKLKANKILIPKDIKTYKYKKEKTTCAKANNTTIRKGYQTRDTRGNLIVTNIMSSEKKDIKIIVDKTQEYNNRYLVLSINDIDKRGSNLTVYKEEIVEKELVEIEDFSIQKYDKTLDSSKIKNITFKNKKYLEIEDATLVLLSDCKQTHGITLDWARIFKTSGDKISIFENLESIINPGSKEDIRLNSNFKELFEAIESDDKDKIIDAQELSASTLDKEVKKLTSKYIVKHSSQWDKKVNLSDEVLKIVNSIDETKLKNKETIIKHLKNEKSRIENLALFDECKGIEGFPQSDKVYHINPIGLVGEFTSRCYCDRDFTVDEVKDIVKELRDSESNVKKKYKYDLFSASSCKIPEVDKTYERFTEELNKTFNKYEINTCLRKIHFLAQSYTESAYFSATREGDNAAGTYLKNKSYYPYIGRGLIQITHGGSTSGTIGYKQYFEYLGRSDYSTKYELLNESLEHALDASGYFWFRGKLLSKGTSLKSKYSNKDGIKKSYLKKSILTPSKYTTLDLNLVADDDNVKQVTYLVNGSGMYHLDKRTKYTNKLKGIFDYDKCTSKA